MKIVLPLALLLASAAALKCGSDGSGIYSADHSVCCPKTCGSKCGARGCDKVFKGSASSCCKSVIQARNRICGKPPCVRKRGNDDTHNRSPPKCNYEKDETSCGRSVRLPASKDTTCCSKDEYCTLIPGSGNGDTRCQKRTAVVKECPNNGQQCGGIYRGDVLLTPFTTCCYGEDECAISAGQQYVWPPQPTTCMKPYKCSGGLEPCGATFPYMDVGTPDNRCCSKAQHCRSFYNAGSFSECVDKSDATCKARKCKNGSTCIESRYTDFDGTKFMVGCRCKPGFAGQYCEKKVA